MGDKMAEELTRNELIDVSTSNVSLADPRFRQELIIRNSSTAAQEITLVLSNNQQAEVNKGIVLKAGESYYASNNTGFTVWSGRINAIASAINGQISIFER